MDSPVHTTLMSDHGSGSIEDMEDKCHVILTDAHRAQTFEGLLNLPIHFAPPNTATASSESEASLHHPILHTVLMDDNVFERWRQFGTNNCLSSDSHIATYLLHHFETSSSLTRCASCQAILPLYCPKCMLQPSLSLNPAPPSSSPVIMATVPTVTCNSTNCNSTLTNSLATTLASFMMGSGNGLELTTTSLADLQSSQLTPGSETLDLKDSVDNSSPTAASPGPKKAKLCKKKKKKGNKGKLKLESYTCTECGTHITPKPKPSAGQRRSTGVQPYRCMDCQESFPYRRLLEEHLFCKKSDGSFKCCHCHAVVLNPGDIRKHALEHTADMPFKCSHCPLAFSLACNLKTHLRTHSGEKPFPCEVCGRAFTQSIALKVHIRKHTGEKPFTCPHCPMAFAASSNLSRHLLKHTGQKPYRCAFCSAAFSQPGSLKTHTRSKHTGERPYVCEHCSAAFSDHSTLWKHRRNNSCHFNSGLSATRSKKQATLPPAPSLLTPSPAPSPLQAVVVSQGASLHLATPMTSVTTNQLTSTSMSVLSDAAAVVSQQQVYGQLQQQPEQQTQQHLQLQVPQQLQQQQDHQQAQSQQQPPSLEGATFVSGVGWCFPIHQQ